MDAYFSDIRTKIVDRLDKAESSIVIAMAWFTNSVLFQLILDKAASKVKVELVLSSSEINFIRKSSLPFDALIRKGAKVSVLVSNEGFQFMHHKFAIIDNKELITGSYNWTNNAHTNHENIMITSDEKLIKIYKLQFDELVKNDNIIGYDQFRVLNQMSSIQQTVAVDENMASLSMEFGNAVQAAMQEADNLHLGVRIDIISGMIKRYTAVGAARKLSNDPEQSGFLKLVTENRAYLTIEYLTAQFRFAKLFDKVTIRNAKEKLRKYIGNEVDNI